MSSETFQFQAESRQLLDLMIHSVYSNKEIFLRELISNASDALDKLRIEALTNSAISEGKFEIRLDADKDAKTLKIIDNGIGMSKEELIANIGTIARSGTKEYLDKLKKDNTAPNASEFIGQFGVGFYSAFMVAHSITILTRKAGTQEAYRWESKGDGEFTVEVTQKETCGTEILLQLKPKDEENELEDYSDYYVISRIVKRYSDFIGYPIMMMHDDKDETLNSMKPIWARNASEVTEEEYEEFYKHISHDWNKPLKHLSYKVEGTTEFQALLFIPSKAPFDLYYQGYKSGLHLYVKRVLIQENFEDLLPHYLRFVKGVVESSDLPLNLSREILQKDRQINVIKKNATKKIIDTLAELLEKDREQYLEFWKEFGTAMKEGVSSDFDNRDKLSNLLLFSSTEDPEKKTTLKEYAMRMKPEQTEIYFVTGESRAIMEGSPHLEIFKKKGFEVLLLTDPVDELVVQAVTEYEGKKLKSVEKGEMPSASDDEKKDIEKKAKEYKDVLKLIEDALKDHIKQARVTNRLVSAPACIVSDEADMSPHLEKILKKGGMISMPATKRILEVNPEHPLLLKMQNRFAKDKNDPILAEYSELLLGYATLAEGAELPNPMKFNEMLIKLMDNSLS